MAVDPFLYVAFGAGLVAGRLVSWRSPWVERATMLTVVALLLLLGASLVGDAPSAILAVLPLTVAFTAMLLGLTAALAALLAPRRAVPPAPPTPVLPSRRFRWELVFGLAVVVGYFGVGRLLVPSPSFFEYTLYLLLALVGFDLRLSRPALGRIGRVLGAAAVAAVGTAAVFVGLGWMIPRVAFGTALAFGWYSLAGPLVAAQAGPTLGLIAFLVNFFRENATMLSAPWAGRRIHGEGIAALGGATAMDTTLYFVVRFGDPEAGTLALASGLVLTLLASVLVPLALGLP